LTPLKSMIKHGLIIAGGSDAPCSPPNPIFDIYAACNHPNPDESISILDALRMHTNWAARLSFDEHKRGTLTEGKFADFAVLDRNPLTLRPQELKDMKVIDLYLNGSVYESAIKTPFDLCMNALKNKILRHSFSTHTLA